MRSSKTGDPRANDNGDLWESKQALQPDAIVSATVVSAAF